MYLNHLGSTLLAVSGLAGLTNSLPVSEDTDYFSPPQPCKCFPGDSCWPSASEWAQLNETVDGRLIATVPLGTPCHGPNYDPAVCQDLQQEWLYSTVHEASSSSVMAPLFANQSCDPFQPATSPCTLGNYVRYAVNVSTPAHIASTLQFAEQHNIRFIIRNTGHDYLGRSTGAGAIAVWTHYLNEATVLDWEDDFYTGKALQIGAGIQAWEALEAAHAAGLVVVTAECTSVGITGGYMQGGGHSALSTLFGLAADNALSYEVVTPQGNLVTASPTQNSDLFFALSGGGGGNYGVVVSAVVRAHPEAIVSGAKFFINTTAYGSDKLYDVVDVFHTALPQIVDSGLMVIYFFGEGFLESPAITAYNKTQADIEAIFAPLINALAAIDITLEPTYTEFPSYLDHYDHYWGPFPAGNIQVGTDLFGGRLISRSALPNLIPAARTLVEMGVTFIGVGLNVSSFGNDAMAVLPQWRDSIVTSSLVVPWSFDVPFADMVAAQNMITNQVQPIIEAVTPNGGAYMNEADFQQPDFQETFFGTNYPRLLEIKNKYDPAGLLYAVAGVGSEEWTVANDGRMCRTAC